MDPLLFPSSRRENWGPGCHHHMGREELPIEIGQMRFGRPANSATNFLRTEGDYSSVLSPLLKVTKFLRRLFLASKNHPTHKRVDVNWTQLFYLMPIPLQNLHWYVQLGCPTFIYRRSTLFWVFVTTVIKNDFIFLLLLVCRWRNKVVKILQYDFDPRWFEWAKKQPMCGGNLTAPIKSVHYKGHGSLPLVSLHTRASHTSLPYIRLYFPQVMVSSWRIKLRENPFQSSFSHWTLNVAIIP